MRPGINGHENHIIIYILVKMVSKWRKDFMKIDINSGEVLIIGINLNEY